MDNALLVITNVPDEAIGETIARSVVEQRLAACVNLLPKIRSVYRWQDAIEEAGEHTLLVKTAASRYAELEAAIKALHPYEVPEIIAIPIQAGLPAYLEWVMQETKKNVDI
ncbi:MAG TPA: divalent-cation tolerance protein CutA [Noviherbaspirillum sp.]|nr:divalent-cation tolerance protein CutA [Noviherbaspirillum sp.]